MVNKNTGRQYGSTATDMTNVLVLKLRANYHILFCRYIYVYRQSSLRKQQQGESNTPLEVRSPIVVNCLLPVFRHKQNVFSVLQLSLKSPAA